MPTTRPEKPRIAALIVAGGVGARAGGELPKQYQPVHGKPMICHSIEAFSQHADIAAVQVVIHPEHADLYANAVAHTTQLLPPILGGVERTDSVKAGLAALEAFMPDYVLIHDAARPFLSASVLDRVLKAISPEAGVVPCLPVVDTVRRYVNGTWEEVARDGLLRIQTPQAFPFVALKELYATDRIQATDDAALWLAAGRTLRYVEGEERLKKMTTAEDIAHVQHTHGRTVTGMGFDVHALIPAKASVMRIGGIDIPSIHQTEGHSDADVALHAIVDALLGTIADGDIGAHYSPKDARWAGADSAIFLRDTVSKVKSQGGRIQHVDLTVIGESPKIGPHRDAMRSRIAQLLELPIQYVSVKATTTEKLGFTGRGEGIAAQAVATVILPEAI